ncbi:MAG: S-methyl-5-thioribose-1-phosphate isomerase [Dehalococcoidia bacterium]
MSDSQPAQIAPIRYDGGTLRLLDQTLLPGEERYIETRDWRDVAAAIRRLAVRGAPLIGIAAAYGMAMAAREHEVDLAAQVLAGTRPTAVNLSWAIRKVAVATKNATKSGGDAVAAAESEARRLHEKQIAADERMGALGAELLPAGATVLTHCNTGTLATGGIGTALGVIKTAHRQGKIRGVLVDETRPLLQGARLTAWELSREGIDYDIIVDGAAAGIMASGIVDAVLVGADRIAANGDTANKVGTYGLALAAQAHDVPFYVVAPMSTVDRSIESGAEIVIEQRQPAEVLEIGLEGEAIVPAGATALNPAFDVTPHALISAIVTERGVLRSPFDAAIASLAQLAAVMR